ncbi:MAG: ribbon-helix-helix protein, CopG family [Chloroflexi bacterium]|nr:ribbon-helix-helix protein, CopG family [Chloroflexota bacterium]
MKRTTITWPEELADAVGREARRRRVSVSEFVRESVQANIRRVPGKKRRIPWAGIIDDPSLPAAADLDAVLAEHWTEDIARDRG